ncbi:hypothetical protein BU24DRAFT_229219 [Aaosphaeria arxii CBS 175.79]|uniref:Uncharacterized protein n=1 Tax=Aaosphaeria arxii CBS 175.79 TaxID=1450172 RepID=A0A6A5XPU8_9PLEO|nr:uncharacterized protein BU24DRAFT_229219 [Aaosphaeria arxii CBS 175.79]KAF2015172.1 hypothetical protein BU24DRAFT_229219 [Aaosphaeria arxii CBS 175.79]
MGHRCYRTAVLGSFAYAYCSTHLLAFLDCRVQNASPMHSTFVLLHARTPSHRTTVSKWSKWIRQVPDNELFWCVLIPMRLARLLSHVARDFFDEYPSSWHCI